MQFRSSTTSAAEGDAWDRLYARSVRLADVLHAHRGRVAVLGVPLVVVALALLNRYVLLDSPNSGDEYVYLFQARTMSTGRLWWPAHAAPELFQTNYVATQSGRMFGTFPPGWPLALASAMVTGAPVWLVNPLIGAATLVLVWVFGTQVHGPRVGVLAAALLAASPFFAFNAASYFSHPLCGALLLAAACLAARPDRTRWWIPVLVGVCIGWAVVVRYFTGAVCGASIIWWLMRPGVGRPRTLILVGLGGLPWVVGLMAYDLALTGSPWQLTTTDITVSHWFAAGVLRRGADILASHVVRHVLWTPPALVFAYVMYLRSPVHRPRGGALEWLPVIVAAGLYFYVERGGNQYGARFHYEVFPFLVVFVSAQLFHLPELGASPRGRTLFAMLAGSVAMMPVSFVVHGLVERDVIRERMDPYTKASAHRLDNAVVLIAGRVGTRRSMAAADLTRNSPGLHDDVLYGIDPGPDRRCDDLARAAPKRTPYLYQWDRIAADGVLTPIVCTVPRERSATHEAGRTARATAAGEESGEH